MEIEADDYHDIYAIYFFLHFEAWSRVVTLQNAVE